MDYQIHNPILPHLPGRAKTRVCPICSQEIFSGLALIEHMKTLHKGIKLYKCEQCTSVFNNLHALSSHALLHGKRWVQCKQCPYRASTRAKMRQHVRKYSKDFRCSMYQYSFLTKSQYIAHQKLHQVCTQYNCKECDAFYYSLKLYNLHVKGNHGVGYVCTHCGVRFDTLSQRARHIRKDHWLLWLVWNNNKAALHLSFFSECQTIWITCILGLHSELTCLEYVFSLFDFRIFIFLSFFWSMYSCIVRNNIINGISP